MQTAFIYSVSRLNTLAQYLLTKTEIERLMVSAPGAALHEALKESYLGPYVAQYPDENIAQAIEQTLIDAKRLIHRQAPNGDMFRVLWVQYDIHNLRVFAKATAQGKTYEACEPLVSERGIYEPAYLFAQAEAGALNRLQPEWQDAYAAALKAAQAGNSSEVDAVLDQAFFATAKRVAEQSKDAFIQRYARAMIDVFNLKGRMRILRFNSLAHPTTFIAGGTLGQHEMETLEQTLGALRSLRNNGFWDGAIASFTETGSTAQLDARVDEYLLTLAREASYDMFSSASLVLYYLLCRQAAANVRTIVVGKNSGMSEADIRANLRLAYVND